VRARDERGVQRSETPLAMRSKCNLSILNRTRSAILSLGAAAIQAASLLKLPRSV
jgi:hypothetical protein